MNKNKNSKKAHIAIAIYAAAVTAVVLMLCLYLQQWNLKGYSKLLNITISEDAGLQEIYKTDDCTVYTYQLAECSSIDFLTGNQVNLEAVLEDGISLKELTACLDKTETDSLIVYKGENYQIVQNGTEYIICSLFHEPAMIASL